MQAYIESENKRLERDPSRCFDAREINVRMEYRYCPNMIVIDTPGMLHPPKVNATLYTTHWLLTFVCTTYVRQSGYSCSYQLKSWTSPPTPHHSFSLTCSHSPSLHFTSLLYLHLPEITSQPAPSPWLDIMRRIWHVREEYEYMT